jgi:hypothetical protein
VLGELERLGFYRGVVLLSSHKPNLSLLSGGGK